MKKIIDFFVDNSVIVNLLSVLIIIMGMISVFSLNKEVFPNVDFNFITIQTVYKGAAAEDVEKLISIEIERELKEVSGIEELNAMSAEGASIVSLKIDPDYDVDDTLVDVRNALSDLPSKIPSDAETPVITKASNSDRSLIYFAIYGKDELTLREDVKYVRDILERYPAISSVEMNGYRDEIFDVRLSTDKLERFDVTLTQVMNAIKDRQTNITAGSIKDEEREKLVRTLVENETVKNLEEVVIISNDVGNAVKVKDVATVSRVLEDKTRGERANGNISLFLGIKTKSSADVIDTANFVKNKIKEISLERDFKFKSFSDLSFYVKRQLLVASSDYSGRHIIKRQATVKDGHFLLTFTT